MKCTVVIDGYTDVTKELARRKYEDLDEKLKGNMDSANQKQSHSGIYEKENKMHCYCAHMLV